jgi:transglutaminase-like putative cysteine protease
VVRFVTSSVTMPMGLSRAYLLALAPAAILAPLPLAFTEGASRKAILGYVLGVAFLWWRARIGKPVRISDATQNVLGLIYIGWLAYSMATLRTGLLPSVAHLLLFTAFAKLASLKRPSEARLALLVVFLLTLAGASSSTHVSSIVYFVAMSWLAFRALARVAVLADFDEAPPERVLTSIPTAGVSAVAIAGGALAAVPLFFALPRLHGPFVTAPIRLDDALTQTLSADRVDLESFGAAKRSDRVVLRLTSNPDIGRDAPLRLREAVFTQYEGGSWLRNPRGERRRGAPVSIYDTGEPRPGHEADWRITADLYVYGQGFLFLPYGTSAVRMERNRAMEVPDGVMQVSSRRGPVRYEADVRRVLARGPGESAISPADVPEQVRNYAMELTGSLTDPREIYKRIEDHFSRDFVYTLDPPRFDGDPLVHFLRKSRAGHCEYFASAAAMMLATRGIRARLVTGSYGGEEGLFGSTIVVRAENLHAWVEADLDGSGFEILDPTPAAGIPPLRSSFSLLSRLAALGREIEFFYDRRVLGFDSADQVGVAEAVREQFSDAASAITRFERSAREALSIQSVLAVFLAAGLLFLAYGVLRRSTLMSVAPPPTRAYLALRRLVARRRGGLSPSVPPAEVARLFAAEVPEGGPDAARVVAIYCATAFGGSSPRPEIERELGERLRRLKKLA